MTAYIPPDPPPPRARRGFTLIEMLIVLTVMGMVVTFAAPPLRRMGDRSNLRGARDELAAMIATARAAAIQKGREGRFHLSTGDTVRVTVDTAANTPMIVVANRSMKELYGVSLSVSATVDTVIPFDSRGFASTKSGNTVRIRFTGPAGVDSLCVTKFGLVLKRGCL